MYKNVLLTVDLNNESSWTKALPTAVECCRAFGARLHVVTVVPDFGSNVVAQYFPEGFEEKMLRATDRQLAEFIVMASHRPELRDYLIGPNAARVMRHANASVLVVRE